MENEKNCYSLSEVITGLREEYIKKQIILNKMSEFIKINTKEKVSIKLSISQKLNNYDKFYWNEPRLWLSVSKKPRYTKDNNQLSDTNVASFLLTDEDDISFKLFNHNNIKIYDKSEINRFVYNPEVIITDQESFKLLYSELKNNKIFNLTSKWITVDQNINVSIDNECIKLIYENEKRNKLSVTYIPDSIIVSSDVRYTNSFINELLQTYIPSYKLTEEYTTLLEENKGILRNIHFFENNEHIDKQTQKEFILNQSKTTFAR